MGLLLVYLINRYFRIEILNEFKFIKYYEK